MSNEPPRRRVRRAKQTRQVSHPAARVVEGERAPEVVAVPVAAGAEPAAKTAERESSAAIPVISSANAGESETVSGLNPEVEMASVPEGTWLPAGIAVMVMVGLLVCAGLVLIAGRQ